ncbi:hypothetical protein Tco_0066048 [Tanacetum coccineum]
MFLSETLQDFGTMPIFKRTFSQDLDLLEQHLTKEIIFQTDCKTILTKLRTTFENAFNSEFKERIQKYTRIDDQSFKDSMICNMDSIGKYMLEIILHQQRTPQLLKQKKLMQTQEDHSNLIQALNVESLKDNLVVIQNTCSEKEDSNSKTASSKSVKESSLNFETKDVHVIKYKMSKAKERCLAYFRSLHLHLQVLSKEELKGTRIEHRFKRAFISLFGQDADTFTSTMLLNVDQLQKQLDKDEFQEEGSMAAFWVINNQFQKFINSQFTLDYDSQMTDKYFVEYTRIEVKHFRETLLQHMSNVKNNGTESEVQDESSMSGNDTDADAADIRPIYDEEPMAKVQLNVECNIFAIGQYHTEQLEIINEGRVDQYPKKCQVKSPMLDLSLDNQTTEYSKQSLESENILLKKTVAQFQKDFSRMEAHCIALELKCQNQSLKSGQHDQILHEISNKAKIKKQIDTIEQTTSLLANNADLKAQIQEKKFAIAALKNELRKLKGNRVDTKFAKTSVLGKPVLQSLRNQSVVRQQNAFKSERPQMSKQRFATQVDVNNNLSRPVTQHYLPKRRESAFAKPDHMIASSESMNSSKNMPRFLSTADDSKPKPRNNNQTPRSLPVSKSSCITITAVPKADHSKSSSSFSDSKNFMFTRHRFSPNKNSDVYEKTSPRSDLRWKPTGRIFKSVGLRWIPTVKLFDSFTSKVDSEPPHGSNVDIPNIHESKQTLDLSAGTSINVQKEQSLDLSAEHSSDTYVFTVKMEILLEPTSNKLLVGLDDGVAASF